MHINGSYQKLEALSQRVSEILKEMPKAATPLEGECGGDSLALCNLWRTRTSWMRSIARWGRGRNNEARSLSSSQSQTHTHSALHAADRAALALFKHKKKKKIKNETQRHRDLERSELHVTCVYVHICTVYFAHAKSNGCSTRNWHLFPKPFRCPFRGASNGLTHSTNQREGPFEDFTIKHIQLTIHIFNLYEYCECAEKLAFQLD